ncbi:EAL domain-containing protein [Novosphingobium sp. 2580]|uniref:cyclic-guanylate-specific phosphodiesterase n=2 Tax=Novosphingobium album (ex Hu et al. 2023) TaxID=2930093 RepID=A0ABT0B6H6_9SPHN|nr:EAL domain-containing protein [Novosphingobium album (ex Hu et al. 2023)]
MAALASSENTADQVQAGSDIINKVPAAAACSDSTVDLMRNLDLSSTLLQAVGRLDGTRIVCSSLGRSLPIDLGKPDFMGETKSLIWTHARLFGHGQPYLVIGLGSFAGIIHRDLPLSFVDSAPGSAISTFTWSQRQPLVVRGPFQRSWLRTDLPPGTVFRSNGYLISVTRSSRYDIGSIAAVPLTDTAHFSRETAAILVPIGLAAGLMLSLLLSRFIRDFTSMPAMIRNGLKRQEFHLLYQPVIDIATGRTIGAEALLRWRRRNGEMIAPDHFIPIAEETGSIRQITRRVLELLTDDAPRLIDIAPDFHIGLNLSAADIHCPAIVRDVTAVVKHSGIKFENLLIEATERSFVDAGKAADAFRNFRSRGARIAVDDFGTGYSGLGYLAQLEVDYLKIDKLFVSTLGTGSATSQVAQRIIEIAKDLQLQVIAEGVETEDQAKMLGSLGVELAQGYYYSGPLTASALLERLRSEHHGRTRHRQLSAIAA